jgi:predicted dehydrogenase
MTRPIRIALFGLGRWGNHLLRNLLALPAAEVVAIVDPNEQRLAEMCDRYHLPPTIQQFTQWPPAMAIPGLQAVVIATPASTHYPMIKQALEQGLHVLTEKPMTLDSATSRELCQLADQQQRQLLVDHTYLFHPAVAAGRDVCQKGLAGNLYYGYGTRTNLGPVRYDVDSAWDLAIHDISILNYWLDQTPDQVTAWGPAWLQPQAKPGFPSGLRDTSWIRIIYPNQLEIVLHVSWLNADKQRRLALVGDQGTLVLDEMSPNKMLQLYRGALQSVKQRFLPTDLETEVLPVDSAEPLKQVCSHFLNCIHENRPSSMSSGWHALELVRVMESIAQADIRS